MSNADLDGYPGSVAAREALPLGQLPLPFNTGDNLALALMRLDESLHLLRDLVQTVDEMNARVEVIEEMLIHRY